MSFEIVDVGQRLLSDGAPPTPGAPEPLIRGAAATWSLLRLAPGEHYDDSDAACIERSFLVLEGFGSAVTAERTTTVAAGLLLLVEVGAAFDLRNDSSAPLVVLLATRPRVLPPKEPT
jgi:mannose-6-phosphate isomerase-like protein (cupin superfamily)